MNYSRKCFSPTIGTVLRHWRTMLGAAVLASMIAQTDDASAGPKAGSGAPQGPHGKGQSPGGRPTPSELFGRPSPDGKHGGKQEGARGKRDHEGGVAGSPDLDRHPHMLPPEGFKKRIEELKQKEAQGTISPAEKQELERMQRHRGPRMSIEQRKARLAELQEKESAGKLTEEEKTEFDRIQKAQARRDAMEKRFAERMQNRKIRSREAKRKALREFPKLGTDAAALAEYKKHADRLAKLERAKELANADERADLVEKIDNLVAQENQRHQAWLARQSARTTSATGANQ